VVPSLPITPKRRIMFWGDSPTADMDLMVGPANERDTKLLRAIRKCYAFSILPENAAFG